MSFASNGTLNISGWGIGPYTLLVNRPAASTVPGQIATWHAGGNQKAYIDVSGTYWSGTPTFGQEATRLIGWINSTATAWMELEYPSNNVSLKDLTRERWKADSSGNFYFNSNYGSTAVAYGCRAWVNFNSNVGGASIISIRASGNVSSVTDGGVGNFTVNFSSSMPDANYAVAVASDHAAGITRSSSFTIEAYGTSSFILQAGYATSFYDPVYCNAVVIR